MNNVLDPEQVVNVVLDALPVRGPVAACRHINGGVAVRIVGHTNRTLACRALTDAGYPVARDEPHGMLRIPAARKATQ